MVEKERILVVTMNPASGNIWDLLEVDGYQVETVVSGVERREDSTGDARFIILDVLMPDLNGLET